MTYAYLTFRCGSPAFPHTSCDNALHGDVFMSTSGQTERMDACLAMARSNLFPSVS